ncbi:protein FAM161A-like [Anthonomus grandis grandis]|uniref:protein FAM161A-like n=1 Tax=Anthonomus grandis grandis TaxID=2921223 RepID=UPI00216546F5|nr:protein FAM161A-like [Anthonomus grandis grandis]
MSLSDKDVIMVKPPSRRSVRIETPSMPSSSSNITPEPYFRSKSRANQKTEWDSFTSEDLYGPTPPPLETKSAPSTPLRTKKPPNVKEEYDGITIPKPFQMTVRDEENKIVKELYLKINKPPKEEKQQQFKAHEVPIESQIPLFDKIMEEQQRRSRTVKERRKNELQAQMRPFSFTRRDEEIQELTKRFSKSLPCVYDDHVPLKIEKFKAKPIPKNLFSNYIYKKMHEDEFYRTLQKKIRAEEMLKLASLPPSMAKREKSQPKFDVCPRSFRDSQTSNERDPTPPVRKGRKIPNYKMYHDKYERELEELKNEFISTSPRPFKLKSSRKRGRRHHCRISSANSSSETRTPSSLDMSSINRSNLAAILRIQSARKRLEMEMAGKLEEAKLKEEARWREKVMRKKPVWQTLTYSHEEDLAMRLQLKRDEERLRNEEHKLRMELMLGRVNQQPTLFERQSQIKFPKTKEELVEHLHKEYKRQKSGSSDKTKSSIEVKDEAVQVQEENNHKESKESTEEVFENNNSRRSSKDTYVVSDDDDDDERSCEGSNKTNNGP